MKKSLCFAEVTKTNTKHEKEMLEIRKESQQYINKVNCDCLIYL